MFENRESSLSEEEYSNLKRLFFSENHKKIKEVSPPIIIASVFFLIFRYFFGHRNIFSDHVSLSVIVFILFVTISFLITTDKVNRYFKTALCFFLGGFLFFSGILGGYNYFQSGDLTVFSAGILFILSIFIYRKLYAFHFITLCSAFFLLSVYLYSKSTYEIFSAIKSIVPYLFVYLIFAFSSSEFIIRYMKNSKRDRDCSQSQSTLEVLYKISDAVNKTSNLNELLSDIHRILSSVVDTKNFFVAIKENEGITCPFFVDEYDDYRDVFEKLRKEDKFSIAGYVIRKREMLILNKEDMMNLAKENNGEITGKLSEVYIGIPLIIQDKAIGALAIQDYENKDAYSEKDIRLLKSVSEQIAVAIERRRFEEKLKESEKMYRIISENSTDVVLKADRNLDITYVSPSAEKFTGFPLDTIYKMNLVDFVDPKEKDNVKKTLLERLIKYQEDDSIEDSQRKLIFQIFINGNPGKWVEFCYRVVEEHENDVKIFAVINDISARKEYEMNLIYQVNHDNLTNLYNRKAFVEELKRTIKYAKRYGEKRVILFIDMDNFKLVNDSFGHAKGDIILKEVADRLKDSLRESDFVARLGGDEFTAILNNPDGTNKDTVIEKIRKNLSENYSMDGIEIDYISASVGVSIYPDNGTDPESLIKYADSDMYKIKDTKE